MSTKSFIILNHTKALSLSPDSGTDYGPFSASSSISPPFLSSNLKDSYFPPERDVIGAEREIFAAERDVIGADREVLETFPSERDTFLAEREAFTAEREAFAVERRTENYQRPHSDHCTFKFPSFSLPLSTSPSSSTSSTTPSISIRRLSGITMTSASAASLAKSTPSISTDVLNERPLSFTVLPNSTTNYETYQTVQQPLASPYKPTLSCSSLASFSSWTPIVTTSATTVSSVIPSTISSMLSSNRHSFGADPSAIKPIVSALEYPQFKSVPQYSPPAVPIEKVVNSPSASISSLLKREHSDTFSRTLERYNKFVEKQKMQLELQQQQQQADFLSLSLSPPMNRRNKEMLALKGSFVCLSEPRSTPIPNDDFQQYTDSPDSSLYGSEDEEQEDVAQYRRGGYHPVHLGDMLHNRYRVVRKLGWGHFSTVWLCRDIEEEKYVALKVVKSAQHYAETAADEIKLLEVIRDADPYDVHHERIVKLLNHFTVRGVNGVHTCLVFEALGCSLYKLIVKNNYQGLAISQVKSIIKQVLQGLDYLHTKCHIIHTDVKPENILIVMDNAAAINQQIDEAIKDLKGRGYGAHWFPDSYANSLESDDDAVIGASSSTTTTSSSFLDGKRISSFEERADQLRGSNGSLNKSDFENDAGSVGASGDLGRYRVEQQRKGSISIVNNSNQLQTGGESKSKLPFKLSKLSSKQISYSGVLQSLLNNPNIKVKIADLGNACFDHYHFTDDIQTRQYRSIEVLLGVPYTYSADIWSTACLTFELATGDYLFDPHSGDNYSRDEDHLAHIIELLGAIPPSLVMRGKHGLKYFTSYGHLRHITKLKTWSLFNVLVEKYEWDIEEARQFTDFIVPMLEYNPLLRATARQCLQHPWLDGVK
ncbi:hypothetical protein ACKWTF_015500 [Chironomus riparius]